MVLTDILKRYQQLKGRPAILCTGTDEHGMKIQRAAEAADTDPQEFCDRVSQTFKLLASRANVANDHFIRTSDPAHKDAVQYAWDLLEKRGFIYQKKHEGWYSVSDETFYPESTIEKRLDPITGRTFMASQETGKEVEWTSEMNYHFKLSAFKDKLLQFYDENPEWIVPASRAKDVYKAVESGLEDLSVSRPTSRLTWGIRVPSDSTQTIYVWLDALINYITVAGYPNQHFYDGSLGWPADVHVIGKDILRFHCIYWPAFLLALDLPLPKQILTHAHWTLGAQKMSKSTGNVVNPFFALERFGDDVMRFYLALEGGIADDADYGNQHIVKQYKKCLAGGLGNLVQRIAKPYVWSIAEAVSSCHGSSSGSEHVAGSAEIRQVIDGARGRVDAEFEKLNPRAALREVMEVVFETNRYITAAEPWNVVKAEAAEGGARPRTNEIIYHCAEAVRVVSILLLPYMPKKAAEVLDVLGVRGEMRTWDQAVFGADQEYGRRPEKEGEKRKIGKWKSLFPPLVDEAE
jgi:methionyl-tRNA synthetase